MTLGEKIAKHINEGLTVAQAAARAGCSRPTAYLALYKAGFVIRKIAMKQK